MQQILMVAGIGVIGVLLLVGALFLLKKEDTPATKDKKVKNQIIEEMLAKASSEEEKKQIIAMAHLEDEHEILEVKKAAVDELSAPILPKSADAMYGINAEKGDTLDKIIAKQLQYTAESEAPAEDMDSNNISKSAADNFEQAGIKTENDVAALKSQKENVTSALNNGYNKGIFAYDNKNSEDAMAQTQIIGKNQISESEEKN